MKAAGAALFFLLSFFIFAAGEANAQAPEIRPSISLPHGASLVWQDEFSGIELDSRKWIVGTAFRDSARQTADAVKVDQGILKITSYSRPGGHSTGFLSTQGLFETAFGFFEAKIRFHDSPGEWCAFWIQSPTIGKPIGDPRLAGVEVDIAEHRATDERGADLRNYVVMNLHWDGYLADHKQVGAGVHGPLAVPLQNGWHTYAVQWTPSFYVFYLNGVKTWETSAAVSHRSQFLRLTCEIRDKSWAGRIPALGYGNLGQSSTGMDVDWVRVWQ